MALSKVLLCVRVLLLVLLLHVLHVQFLLLLELLLQKMSMCYLLLFILFTQSVSISGLLLLMFLMHQLSVSGLLLLHGLNLSDILLASSMVSFSHLLLHQSCLLFSLNKCSMKVSLSQTFLLHC